MAEWKKYKLGEIGKVIGGATPSTKDPDNYGNDIFWITPKDLSNLDSRYISKGERSISKKGFNSCSCQMLPQGSVLFSSRAPIGYIAIAAKELCTNQGFKSIIPNSDIVDNIFLYYLLVYNRHKIEGLGSGTVFKEVSGSVMKNVEVDIPSLEGQKQIADILSSLDDKIEVNRKINENLEQQAEALFKSWFVDFEPFKDGKFIDSELGKIPEGWRVGTFQEIVDIKSGGTPKTTTSEYWNGDIPFFTPKDVSDSAYCFDTEKHITELGLTKCNSALYPKNTIFITARGTVGKISLAGTDMAMNQTCYALVGKTKGIQFYIFWQLFYLVERIKKKANGAVFSAITTKDFDENIVIPPMDYIVKFNNLVLPLFEKIHNLGQENICLSKLRDTLLPKLMSGEISIL